MTTKYMTTCYARDEIKPVAVDKETDSSVWIDGRRRAKLSSYESFFDTWDDAHNYLIALAETDMVVAKGKLRGAQSRLGNIKGMKPPQEAPAHD